MKVIFIAGLLACTSYLFAQKKIERTIPVQAGQTLEMRFDDPQLIKVHTWEKKEVLIRGSVSINRGEHDDYFELHVKSGGNVVAIGSDLRDRDNIPKRTVIHKDGQDYYFQTGDSKDPMIQKFLEEKGGHYTYMSNGIIREITLEIFIPKGMSTSIEAKFGLVELTDFDAPVTVMAPHGGIDATIALARTGDLVARTRFGEILTNLDTRFTPIDDGPHEHWTEIRVSPGKGHAYRFESKFGKVYLRKP